MPNLLAVLHSMAKNRPQRTVLVSPSAPAPIRTLKCDISPRSHGNGMTMSRERTDTPIPTLHLPATPHHEGVLPPAVCANRNTRMLFASKVVPCPKLARSRRCLQNRQQAVNADIRPFFH